MSTTPESGSEALDAEQRARLGSLRDDLEALRRDADPSVPPPEPPDGLLVRLVIGGSPYATLPRKFLARCGFEPPPPETVADDEIRRELWQLIWVLALLRMFLENTDHLGDRELYEYLYHEALLEPTAFMPGEENPPFYSLDPSVGLDPAPRPVHDRDRLLP